MKVKPKGYAHSSYGITRHESLVLRMDETNESLERWNAKRLRIVRKLDRSTVKLSGDSMIGRARRLSIRAKILKLDQPLFAVSVGSNRFVVNRATMVDWVQNKVIAYNQPGTTCLVSCKQRRRQDIETSIDELSRRNIWKRRQRKTRPEHIEAIQRHRANKTGLGLAQEAYRLARLEGDPAGCKLAYNWLFDGQLSSAIQQQFEHVKLSKDQTNFLARCMLEGYLKDKLS